MWDLKPCAKLQVGSWKPSGNLPFYSSPVLYVCTTSITSYVFLLFDSDVCVWWFEGCARFIIDCLCDRKCVQPCLLTLLNMNQLDVFITSKGFFAWPHISRLPTSLVHVSCWIRHAAWRREWLIFLSLCLTVSVSFFLTVWHFKNIRPWLPLLFLCHPAFSFSDSTFSTFNFSWMVTLV